MPPLYYVWGVGVAIPINGYRAFAVACIDSGVSPGRAGVGARFHGRMNLLSVANGACMLCEERV